MCHSVPLYSLEYIADESLLLSSSFDGCVRLWNLHGEFIGRCVAVVPTIHLLLPYTILQL